MVSNEKKDRPVTAARLQHVDTVAHAHAHIHTHSSVSVTHMCVIILWRKTPSTKSMNMESLSSEPDPRGPKVLTCKKIKKSNKVVSNIMTGCMHSCTSMLSVSELNRKNVHIFVIYTKRNL